MLERGDLSVSHEPFSDLAALGETDVDGRAFHTTESFRAWLRDETTDIGVFLKDTPNRRHEWMLDDRAFLTGIRHAFLIRKPEEIAASFRAIESRMTLESLGLDFVYRLYTAVRDSMPDSANADGGVAPVVIDSDDLVTRPAATMAAYCDAVGLPFREHALRWAPGPRHEWHRSERWHRDVSETSGFEPRVRDYERTVETSAELARLAAHHRPFYERLYRARLRIDGSETGS